MSKISYPLYNGVYPGWVNIEIRVADKVINGFTELNWSIKVEPGEVRGAGGQPIGYTLGMASYEGDMTILEPQYYELIGVLGDNYMSKAFNIFIARGPIDDTGEETFDTYYDALYGVRLTGSAGSGSATSGDALVKKLTIKPLRVLENGISPFPQTPSADI